VKPLERCSIKSDNVTLDARRAKKTNGKRGGDRKSEEVKEAIKNDNIILDRPKQGTSRAYTLDRDGHAKG
jgi:hypothetical protein